MNLKDLNIPEYPEDVPGEETEEEINEVVGSDDGVEVFHRNRGKQIRFVSTVYWALESNHTDLGDRRKAAQDTALDVFDWSNYENPPSQILNICGQQAFQDHFQPSELHTQKKWQRFFEQLVQEIEFQEI